MPFLYQSMMSILRILFQALANRWAVILIVGVVILGMTSSLRASDPPDHESFIDRMMNPDRSRRSDYQGKMFDTGSGFTSKSFAVEEYAGVKEFESKPFVTKSFEGEKKSWFAKIFPEKKLPENLREMNRNATKQFAAKNLSEKSYADVDKKSGYANHDMYATSDFLGKGKAQGSLDNDQHLQEAVKKGLSEEDVRKLLNKPL
jgi:hypothetical protein